MINILNKKYKKELTYQYDKIIEKTISRSIDYSITKMGRKIKSAISLVCSTARKSQMTHKHGSMIIDGSHHFRPKYNVGISKTCSYHAEIMAIANATRFSPTRVGSIARMFQSKKGDLCKKVAIVSDQCSYICCKSKE